MEKMRSDVKWLSIMVAILLAGLTIVGGEVLELNREVKRVKAAAQVTP